MIGCPKIVQVSTTEPPKPYIRTTQVSHSQMIKEFNRLFSAGHIPRPVQFPKQFEIAGRKWVKGLIYWFQLENGDWYRFVWSGSVPVDALDGMFK